jgi:hypothetical protein
MLGSPWGDGRFDTLWTRRISIESLKPFVRLSNGDAFPGDASWFLFGCVGFLICGGLCMELCFAAMRRFAPERLREAFPHVCEATRKSQNRNG